MNRPPARHVAGYPFDESAVSNDWSATSRPDQCFPIVSRTLCGEPLLRDRPEETGRRPPCRERIAPPSRLNSRAGRMRWASCSLRRFFAR